MEYELTIRDNQRNRRNMWALLGMFADVWAQFVTDNCASCIQFTTDSAATWTATEAVFSGEEWPE